jgi:uncharacterized membrane protein YgdD (TMEM256/DUF423 family)
MSISMKWQRLFSGFAALLCMLSVMMAAYASHGLQDLAQSRMNLAAGFAFMHGLALLVLVTVNFQKPISFWSCALMLLGVCLFSGSLALSALFEWRALLAPSGGSCLILAWAWLTIHFWRG